MERKKGKIFLQKVQKYEFFKELIPVGSKK